MKIFKILKQEPTPAQERLGGDPGIVGRVNLCYSCAHYHKDTCTTCEAFPEGIPLGILMGNIDHTKPYAVGDSDDHGLTYTPKDRPEPENVKELFD